MSKIKKQLRLRMLGQLSDEKTNIDINNAYSELTRTPCTLGSLEQR